MNKGIKLTPTQIKACEVGATMFLFPLTKLEMMKYKNLTIGEYKKLLPVQKGDKDIFIQEEFIIFYDKINYIEKFENGNYGWSHRYFGIQKQPSRYSFSECIDVRVIRVQDTENINTYDEYSIFLHKILGLKRGCYSKCIFEDFYNKQLQEQNINRTYEDNDYVFIVEFKR